MKVPVQASERSRAQRRACSGFTLMEVMVASAVGLLVMGGAMAFMQFAGTSMSGVTAQSGINQQAGNAIEFIQSRARLATMVSNDASGKVLTLAFDDNPLVDSDGDGKAYNDQNHFERFQFLGLNGSTNTASTNSLVYIPDISGTNRQVLISSGIHTLPGYNIFTVTNRSTAIIRFRIVPAYAAGHYQSVDIQATAVPLNRPPGTNVISIVP